MPALLGLDGGAQPGEPAADDDELVRDELMALRRSPS